MAEKLNKEILGLVTREDVFALMEQLPPWEWTEIAERLYFKQLGCWSESDILDFHGIDPMDHVDEKTVKDRYEDDILADADEYKLVDALMDNITYVDASDLIGLLEQKFKCGGIADFDGKDIEDLERLIDKIKKKKEED